MHMIHQNPPQHPHNGHIEDKPCGYDVLWGAPALRETPKPLSSIRPKQEIALRKKESSDICQHAAALHLQSHKAMETWLLERQGLKMCDTLVSTLYVECAMPS